MIVASKQFKEKLKSGANIVNYADFTLSDGTALHLEPKDFMIGGCTVEDKTTDGNFGVGFVIGKTLKIRISNHDERFSQYDFYSSIINLYVAMLLDDGSIEKIRKGVYYTLDPVTPGDIIEISAVDGMYKLDQDYSGSSTTYPATLQTIITQACTDCGIPIGFTQFDNMDFIAQTKPENVTYRQVISYACQVAGYNARIDNDGYMKLVWYDTDILNSYTYDGGNFKVYPHDVILDGGNFTNYESDEVVDGGLFTDKMPEHIFRIKSLNVSTDDVQITGIRVYGTDDVLELFGEDGYVLEVKDNPFAYGSEAEIAAYLGARIVGTMFRPFSAQALNNPLYEPFDVVRVSDRKGNVYQTILNSVSYTIGAYTNVACEAEDPVRQGSTYFSQSAQAVADARRNTEKQITDYDKAVQDMNQLAMNAMGYHTTYENQPDGSRITYLHDKPTLEESTIIYKQSIDGFFVSQDGGESYTAGYDKFGNAIFNVIHTMSLYANQIIGGRLEVKKGDNITLLADVDTGEVRIVADYFALASGQTIDSIAESKASAAASSALEYAEEYADSAANDAVNSLNQTDILNKLTNNGQDDGIYLLNGKLYISFSAMRGDELTLGGSNNVNGVLKVLDSSGNQIGYWSKDGFIVNNKYFAVTETGRLSSNRPTFGYTIRMSGGVFSGQDVPASRLDETSQVVMRISESYSSAKGSYSTLHIGNDHPGEEEGEDYLGLGAVVIKSQEFDRTSFRFDVYAESSFYGSLKLPDVQSSTSGRAAIFPTGKGNQIFAQSSSSKRYKTVGKVMEDRDIDDLYHIKVYWARYKAGYLDDKDERADTEFPMFIAEDVEKYAPLAVDHNDDGQAENWNYRVMIPYMFQMIKSQKETIDDLKGRIEQLESLLLKGDE